MRDMQFKKINIFSVWYWLAILFGVSVVFLVDALLYVQFYDHSYLNEKQFFGLLGNNEISLLSSIVLLVIYIYFAVKKDLALSMIFVSTGAISNLIGRTYFGGVVDYIKIGNIPIFNIADILITLGLLLALLQVVNKKRA